MKIVNYKRFIFSMTILLLLTASIINFSMNLFVAEAMEPQVTVEHRVVPGDTLWGIAKEFYNGGSDLRNLIVAIEEMNGLMDDQILPGQVLIVPLNNY